MSKEFDVVSAPKHYAGDGVIECRRALSSMLAPADVTNQQAYWWGCAFKYLWRWPMKNGVEDLKKAKQCIDYLLKEYEQYE